MLVSVMHNLTYVVDYTTNDNLITPLFSMPGNTILHTFDEEKGLICFLQEDFHAFRGASIFLFDDTLGFIDSIRIGHAADTTSIFIVDNLIILRGSYVIVVSFALHEENVLELKYNHARSRFLCYNPFDKELWGTRNYSDVLAYSVNNLNLEISTVDYDCSILVLQKLQFFSPDLAADSDSNATRVYRYNSALKHLHLGECVHNEPGERILLENISFQQRAIIRVLAGYYPFRFITKRFYGSGVDETTEHSFSEMMKTFSLSINSLI
ncbi:hypothetical protein PCE1_004183 [Barthelona sp. PCE]